MKISFVILNFNTTEDTIDCINSIRSHIDLHEDEYAIIVVDNGSEKESINNLESYFSEGGIVFIKNNRNIGFAKGNNVGISYALKNYNPDYIVVCNSDTMLIQDNFYTVIDKEYSKSKFALLGPMMLTGDGRCNDSPWKPCEIKDVEERLVELKKEKKRLNNGTYYIFKTIELVKKKLGVFRNKVDRLHVQEDFWTYHTQVELQGAFLIFSRRAFNHISGFDPRTFLYYEEQLLFLMLTKAGEKIVYNPQIAIYHKDGSSTKKIKKKPVDKLKFIVQCNIDSLEILLQSMKEDK